MTDTEKIQLAEDWYNDPSTTQKEKALLEKLFPEIKPMYFLEIPAGDIAPAEEDGPIEEDFSPEFRESEEQPMDEKIRQYLIQMVNAIRADDFELSGLNKEEVLVYLEKQKEQQPTERSEEDEKCIKDIIDCLKYLETEDTKRQYNGDRNINPKRYANMIAKLKSLRPQLHWKPSDRQLGALLTALGDEKKAGSDVATDLRNLYYDLKKLLEV